MRSAVVLVGLLLVGCAGEGTDGDSRPGTGGPRTEAEVVAMEAWLPGDPQVAADPFASERPAGVDCPLGGAGIEGSSFEVDTGVCTWAWFQQPALADLVPGDVVEVVLWHSALVSDPPAEAHLALQIGDDLLYERVVPVPTEAAAYTESIEVPFRADAGEIVTFHLHNHGANTWNLLRVERLGDEGRR